MLTKSAYIEFLRCPREFWLSHNSIAPTDGELSLHAKHLREQGYDIQRLAEKMTIFQTGIVSTQMRFVTDDMWTSSDIVTTDPFTKEISIYEVKSGSKVKDEYIADVAFQKMVAESLGYKVVKTHVITVDTSYTRNGSLNPDELLKIDDVTDEVIALQAATLEQTKLAFKYLETPPVPSLTEYCDKKLDCGFIQKHFPDIPEYNVTNISHLHKNKLAALLSEGIVDIRKVPADFQLTDRQRKQVDIACGTEPHIDEAAIGAELRDLQYPLNFLDYEAFSYAVPHYEGIRPYQQMLFQYSLHTIPARGAEPVHRHRLSRGNGTHPAREIADSLHADLGGNVGTVIVWSKGFEKMCNSQLALLYPELCDFLESINTAIFDLKKIFSDGHYIDPGFRGSASIKNVLPVLCPQHRYDALEIGDGTTAAIKWYHMTCPDRLTEEHCQKIYDDLCTYCHLDTLAMVRIWQVLQKHASG
jgi:hypothetical protein